MNDMPPDAIGAPGFSDPVADAQAVFRAVLAAMATPGSLHEAGARLNPPAPLDRATAAVLLSLVDGETPLFLSDDFAPARGWIGFHCGPPLLASPAGARFALSMPGEFPPALPRGTDEAPEDGASLILQLPALGQGTRYRLAGPGLPGPAIFAASGLPAGFAAAWQENHALYPRGIDLILCAGTTLAALPRSVTLEAI